MINYDKLTAVKDNLAGEIVKRLVIELEYCIAFDKENGSRFEKEINDAIDIAYNDYAENACITGSTLEAVEKRLEKLGREIKKYTLVCVAHAHIDMNWMWGYDETISVTVNTFSTMLDLMDEYPDFCFSQSQASTYEIIEKYAPELLPRIKQRVKEGRWELSAVNWVEADKNMPNLESFARHILLTKDYLSKLFDVDKDDLCLDFEPDTFGHSLFIPEILAEGNVKYYYQHRGIELVGPYRWKSPSGKEVIGYAESQGYNADIMPGQLMCASFNAFPYLFKSSGLTKMLKVYGVGDHGGGATRNDLDSIIKINKWPLMPHLKFGTYKEFFEHAEANKDKLQVIEGEHNPVFTGCYTSQSLIKQGNKEGENKLFAAELYNAACGDRTQDVTKKAWKNILFNQFHDILTGSGVQATREYASGLYQEAKGIYETTTLFALKKLCEDINSSDFIPVYGDKISRSEGAGVGFSSSTKSCVNASQGRGLARGFAVFNPTTEYKEEVITIAIWDYPGKFENVEFYDSEGNILESELVSNWKDGYGWWGHFACNYYVKVGVPALSYTVIKADQKKNAVPDFTPKTTGTHEAPDGDYILENSAVKAVFDRRTAELKSFVNKKTNVELVKNAHFSFVKEDTSKGMISWKTGRHMEIYPLDSAIIREGEQRNGKIIKEFKYHTNPFGINKGSAMTVSVTLNGENPFLNYHIELDWKEWGINGQYTPQLYFNAPLTFEAEEYTYDCAAGVVKRKEFECDMPGNSFVASEKGINGVMLVSNCKYGFRGEKNSLGVDLIRSSTEPDTHPEFGRHAIDIALVPYTDVSNSAKIRLSAAYNQKLTYFNLKSQKGSKALNGKLFEIESDAVLSAVKKGENDSDSVVMRFYEADGRKAAVKINTLFDAGKAYVTDLNEKEIKEIPVKNGIVETEIAPYSIMTVKINRKK